MLGDIHAAVTRLRETWPSLQEAVHPGNARRTVSRATPAQLEAAGRLHQAELREWIEQSRRGDKPMGMSPAPLSIAAIDAAAAVEQTLAAVADELYRATHANGLAVAGGQDQRVAGYLAEIAGCADRAHPDLWPAAAGRLDRAATLAETVSGHHARPQHLYGDPVCPCCGDRALRALMDALDERMWTVTCTSRRCVCRGIDCDCGRAGRTAGARHVWTVGEWRRLADQINAA